MTSCSRTATAAVHAVSRSRARRCTVCWDRPANSAVLRCPSCHAHFDVVHAGACVDGNGSADAHLEPVPLLERDGVLSMAVAGER